MTKKVEKVVAYIIRNRQLLVFIHEEDKNPVDESGLQVPAGTCKPRELPQDAVLRETQEETGIQNLKIVKYLGKAEYDIRPYANETHMRHFFQLAIEGSVEDEWEHVETSGNDNKHSFKFYWIPIKRGHALAAGQGAMLGRIV